MTLTPSSERYEQAMADFNKALEIAQNSSFLKLTISNKFSECSFSGKCAESDPKEL